MALMSVYPMHRREKVDLGWQVIHNLRSGSRFFGEPTAGATTGNVPYRVSHDGLLAVATRRTQDRDGKKYVGPDHPDEVIKGMRSSTSSPNICARLTGPAIDPVLPPSCVQRTRLWTE